MCCYQKFLSLYQPRLQGALSLAQRVHDTGGFTEDEWRKSDVKGADDEKRRERKRPSNFRKREKISPGVDVDLYISQMILWFNV